MSTTTSISSHPYPLLRHLLFPILYRKPLKLPRPCFPMARQCVKLRRTNPPTLKGPLQRFSRATLETRTRNFFFKPELGVLSCSRLLRSSVWHLGQPTACNNIPTRPPRLKNRTASFVQEAGGPRQWMGEEVCGTWYIPFLKIVMNGIRFGSAHLLVALCSRLECFLCAFQQMVHLLPRRAFCSFALLD